MKNELREYQSEIVRNIHEKFIENQSVLLQMPTGTGKTIVFSKLIYDYLNTFPNKRIFILVHRKELLIQTKERLYSDYGLNSCAIASDHETDWNYRVIVCMVQTLKNRTFRNIDKHPSLLVVDEAHHTASKTYEDIIEYLIGKESKLLGVTATPIRLDGRLLAKYYNAIIVAKPIKWFIENNFLSKLKFYGAQNIFINQLKINKLTLDYDEEDSFKLMSGTKIIKDVIDSILTFAKGKKTLIFAVNQNHSRLLKKKLDIIGIISEVVDSNTKNEIRNEIINNFKNNTISILINVQIFTEGFDCPDIEVVVLARPTKSLTLYLQMIGRVTRNPNYPNSNTGIILDNAGNWRELGLPTYEHDWEEEFNIEKKYQLDSEGVWIKSPNFNKETKFRRLKLPIEIINLPMLELLIEGDSSYDSTEVDYSHIHRNQKIKEKNHGSNLITEEVEFKKSNIFSLPEGIYEIEENVFFQVDSFMHVFFINEGKNKILSRPFFNSLIEYRKYIVNKSTEIGKKISSYRSNQNQDICLHLLNSIDEINHYQQIEFNLIPKLSLIANSVSDEDFEKRVFTWLWNSLKDRY